MSTEQEKLLPQPAPAPEPMDAPTFAGKIRAKYPGAYDGLDDVELSRRVLNKFPDYRPLVRLPDSALKPSTSSTVREDVDFNEDFSGAQLYPDAQPETAKLDVGQAIAKYFHDRARPDLPEMPKGYGQEMGAPVQVKVYVPKGRYPTADEVDDAVMHAMGGETYQRAYQQYRAQAGQPLGQALFDVASVFQRGEAGYVEDGKGGGYYVFNVAPTQRFIKTLNTYLQTGSVDKVKEVDRQIAEADERFNREYLAAKQKAEENRGVLDAIGTGADEAAAKVGQALHNLGSIPVGAYTRAVHGRDSAEMQKLVDEDKEAQAVVDASEAAVPEETTTVGKIARGVTDIAGNVATKGWMGPAFPLGVFAENIHRGPMEATRRAAPTVPMVLAGGVVGKVADELSPAARQVVARSASGATNAGTAALAGERDPVNLGLAGGMGLAMPVGKAGEASAEPAAERFTHPVLGELTAVADQSGVPSKMVRVTDGSGLEPFVVRRPNPEGVGGVRYADESLNPPAGASAEPQRTPLRQTVVSTWKAGLLGLKTHLRNVGSTGSMQALEEFSRLPASITDLAVSAFTGRRSISGPNARAVGRSSLEAATEGVSQAKEILKQGATDEQLARYGEPTEINSGSKILDTYVNGSFRLLAAEDQVFRTYALRRSLEDQARVEAINQAKQGTIPRSEINAVAARLVEKPTYEMQAQAVADAEVATFNNQNVVARGYQSAREAMEGSSGGRAVNTALDVLLPFTRTPTNIIARTLEYTPAGGVKAVVKAARQAMRGEFTQSEQRAFSQTMGRAATGSALILLGFTLADKGLLTGAPGKDPRSSAENPSAPAFSLRVDDQWHKIAGFSPLGDLLSLGATIHQLSKDESRASAATDAALKLVGEQPMLKQSGELYDAATSPGSRGVKFLGRLAGSAVPTVVSDAASAIDDKERARGNSFWNQIAIRVPFLRELLPESKDATGAPAEHRRTDFFDPTTTRSVADAPDRQAAALAGEVESLREKPESQGLSDEQLRHNARVSIEARRLLKTIDDAGLSEEQSEQLRHRVNLRLYDARVRGADDRRALSSIEGVFSRRLPQLEKFVGRRIQELKGSPTVTDQAK